MLENSTISQSSTKQEPSTTHSNVSFPSSDNPPPSSLECHNLTLYLFIIFLPLSYLILNTLLPEQNIWFTFKTNYIDNRELLTFQIITEHNISTKISTNLTKLTVNLSTEGCTIPKLDPFDKSIIDFIRIPEEINCTDKFPFLFDSLLNSSIKPLTAKLKQAGYETCCYRTIHRRTNKKNNYPDSTYQTSKDCYPLSIDKDTTITDPTHEFLAIICKSVNSSTYRKPTSTEKPILKNGENSTKKKKKEKGPPVRKENVVDMHISVPLKPEVEKRIKGYYKKLKIGLGEQDKVNVVILGLDAMSRMNFLRQMPKVHDYLINNLSAVGMEAFNKIGVNTMPNVGAVLTSLNSSELQICSNRDAFDKCPFIWNEYASQGYRTSFGEDTTWMGIFNYLRRGFLKIPTDYYLRPYDIAANDFIGTHIQDGARLCQGPRLTLNVLLDYMKKMAVTMSYTKRYFQLVWSTGLSHSYLNDPKLSEKPVLSFLKWLHDNGYLNETIFILMSDHGIRWGPIFDKLQGQLEVRLPFLYFVVPPWFEQKYSRAVKNLRGNRERLTTPFDLHQTLKDLLNLTNIENKQLKDREKKLDDNVSKWSSRQLAVLPPSGLSQFLPLPKSRNCETARIEKHYCTCHDTKILAGDLQKDYLVQQVANFIVHSLNLMISKKAECAFLALEKVKRAATIGPKFDPRKAYQLIVETKPGAAVFEATVERKGIQSNNGNSWKLSGEISRINKYGNQSHCVDQFSLKPYCHCVDLLHVKVKSK